MELSQLKYFTAVAEELHFGKAAKRLHISQPPLSIQIRKLEEELGTVLFHRTSRVVELTEAGKVFLPEARNILENAERARERMNAFADGKSGFLTIGFNEPAINTFLPEAVYRFQKKHPEIELRLEEIESAAQFEALRARRITLGFLRPSAEKDLEEFFRRKIFSEGYLLAMENHHPLARYSSIPPEALNRTELLVSARKVNPGVFDKIVSVLRGAGVRPHIRQDASSKSTALALVRAGVGIALVTESIRNNAPEGVAFRTLGLELPPVEIYAVWRKDAAEELIRHFLSFAEAAAKNCGKSAFPLPATAH